MEKFYSRQYEEVVEVLDWMLDSPSRLSKIKRQDGSIRLVSRKDLRPVTSEDETIKEEEKED